MTEGLKTAPAMVRDTALDCVRIIACLAVVLLHVSARPIYMQTELSPWGWLLGNAVSSLTHWCVPVFVMLSAVLILGNKKTTYSNVLGSRVPRMLAVLIISSIIYAFWMKYFQLEFNGKAFFNAILMGQPYYHLHFFYLILGLYLIAPPLSQAVVNMDEKNLRNAVIATCTLTMVTFAWSTFSRTYTPNGGSFSWSYISYFLLGYYLYKFKPNLPYGLITVFGYLVTVVGTMALAYGMGKNYTWKLYFYSYFSPTVFAMSIGVWGLGLKVASKVPLSVLTRLAPLTLLVYILHPMFMELLRSQYGKISASLMRPIIEVPLTFALTTLGAFVAAYLLHKIPAVRRLF
ncbi:acyltransferase family protein [Pseudomonas cichorii]|nr:acyltransferase family protein [Pseudomonas cichorii]MBX8539430.1 acyltransferase family protein [Pseudomonas cichorii]MBX8547366.1 acyltransferase family protein [Pseudomonas cichorii]MBX8561086.1 acyltransferase family protein [Pseudomonas cichorii]MBX8564857.1 acyltransferase family protein [Pseudomonas cichorii]MBX8579358.1 acyltransferase family protein [Pseudomonas cichorii]